MNRPPFSAAGNIWCARQLADLPSVPFSSAPLQPDDRWQPLRQHWVAKGPEAGFQPGWARVGWHPQALLYEAVFAGGGMQNRAVRLNELTWELGDVCEIFLQADDGPHYIELHVTPENNRLQLRFPPDGIAAVRGGRAKLEDFMVADPDWVQTSTSVTPGRLSVRALIPWAILGPGRPAPGPDSRLSTAVCRYDCRGRSGEPILSSTALLAEPFFHRRHEWHRLALTPPATPAL